MDTLPENGGSILERALYQARALPFREVRLLFREAERVFAAAGQTLEVARVLIEEAFVLASSFESHQIREAHDLLERAEEILKKGSLPDLEARLLHARGYALLRS